MALHLQASSRDHAAEIWSSDSDPEELTTVASSSSSSSSSSCTTSVSAASPPPTPPPAACQLLRQRTRTRTRRSRKKSSASASANADAPVPEPEAEDVWRGAQWEAAWPARRDPKPVLLAAAGGDDDAVGRSRSLTDDDLEELKGCADLGFGFSYDEIPELKGTLPALELCYSMTQRLQLDDVDKDKPTQEEDAADAATDASAAAPSPPPVTNWKISSPGDSPDEVKARLKYWAQAVACTVRLCS